MDISSDAQKLLLCIFDETNLTGKDTVDHVDLLKFGYSSSQIDTIILELKSNDAIDVNDKYVSSPTSLTPIGLELAKKLKS